MLALRLQESRPERGDPHHGVFHCALQAHRCFDHRRVTRDAKRRAVNFPSFALARAGIAHRHVDFLPPVARARQLHKHTLGLSSLLPFLPGSQGGVHLGKALDFDFSRLYRLSPDISPGGLRGGERALFLAPVAHAPRSIACAPVSVLAAPVGPKPVVEADPQFTVPGKTDHVLEKSYEQEQNKKTRTTRGGRGGLTHPSPPPPTPLPGAQTAPTTRPSCRRCGTTRS